MLTALRAHKFKLAAALAKMIPPIPIASINSIKVKPDFLDPKNLLIFFISISEF
jgi:hypothetical protein